MKKTFIGAMFVGAMASCGVAHGFLFGQNNYCLQPSVSDGTGSMSCHWCAASGVTDNGTCKAGYAGCFGKADVVSLGNSVSDADGRSIKCTQNGWCYTSCNFDGHWGIMKDYLSDSVEVWYYQSGCQCDTYSMDTRMVRCAAGWYGVPDRYTYEGCQRCPDFGEFQATSTPGTYGPDDIPMSEEDVVRLNADISSCYIGAGEYTDDTGTFILRQACCYDGTSNCAAGGRPPRPSVTN